MIFFLTIMYVEIYYFDIKHVVNTLFNFIILAKLTIYWLGAAAMMT